jgi:hypothetical protein
MKSTERERGAMGGSNLVWTIVGVLVIIILVIYLLGK